MQPAPPLHGAGARRTHTQECKCSHSRGFMLRLVQRRAACASPRVPLRRCSVATVHELEVERYHALANCTIEAIVEVFEDFMDASPELDVDVDFSVCSLHGMAFRA